MLKYKVIIEKAGNTAEKPFKEKTLAESYFNSIKESLHKKGASDYNGAALIEIITKKSQKNNLKESKVNRFIVIKDGNGSIINELPYAGTQDIDEVAEAKLDSYKNKTGDINAFYTIETDEEAIEESYNILKKDGFTNTYWNMILEDKGMKKTIYEEIEVDLDTPSEQAIEDNKDEPEVIQSMYDTGMANILISEINGEWDTINNYNSLVQTALEQNRLDIVTVVKDIIEEENKHIGQLQKLLKDIKPETAHILQGEIEAQKQIADIITNEAIEVPNDEPDNLGALKNQALRFKFTYTPEQIQGVGDLSDFIIKISDEYKLLDYIFGNKLKSWSMVDGCDRCYHIILTNNEKFDVTLKTTDFGVKAFRLDNGEEILPIGALDYPDTVTLDTEIEATISDTSLASMSDDLDYINNFQGD